MTSEAFLLGDKDLRLPGLGSYMSDAAAMIWAVVAMIMMIIALDQRFDGRVDSRASEAAIR